MTENEKLLKLKEHLEKLSQRACERGDYMGETAFEVAIFAVEDLLETGEIK